MMEHELVEASYAWDRAMVSNDADAIGEFMADDWLIVGADGRESDKSTFLGHVRTGDLTHDTMTSDTIHVRLYGDTAVVLSEGISGGCFRGSPFRQHERASSVFVRQDGRWRCVLTHLSVLAPS